MPWTYGIYIPTYTYKYIYVNYNLYWYWYICVCINMYISVWILYILSFIPALFYDLPVLEGLEPRTTCPRIVCQLGSNLDNISEMTHAWLEGREKKKVALLLWHWWVSVCKWTWSFVAASVDPHAVVRNNMDKSCIHFIFFTMVTFCKMTV